MNKRASLFAAVLLLGASAGVGAEEQLDALVDAELPSLLGLYKQLHAAPELSQFEKQTAATVAKELRAAGFEVTENVGRYEDPGLTSYGLVGVLRNGAGPVVLIRTDLDALPVEERTGLPYASTVRAKSPQGQDVGVMHACGHDIHMSSFVGTARTLAKLKSRWHGTLVLVGQPAEEVVKGAKAMLADGLYTRFPKPDYAIALHDWTDMPAGTVGVPEGYALSSANSVDILVRGIGGHGSRPEASKDPIVLASQIVLALQTIASREVAPRDPVVVTVGSIHGGSKHNIIPDEVRLQLTVRTYKEEVRRKVLAAIERIAVNTARAAGLPEDLLPVVTVDPVFAPATYNDPELTRRLKAAFVRALGQDKVVDREPVMGSEDVGIFGGREREIPVCMFFLGGADPVKLREAEERGGSLPSLHSALWAPVPEPTIRSGVIAMTAAALELLGK